MVHSEKDSDDIVAKAEETPDLISDQALEDVEGGFQRRLNTHAVQRGVSTTITADDLKDAVSGDTIADTTGKSLAGPGKRFPDPYGM